MPKTENPIMQYFTYAHLPKKLKGVSQVIANTAKLLNDQLPDGPEKSTGLRKLLEAKDCFVRHAVNSPTTVNSGQLSDGFHSFNELYAHRMQLFAVVCHQNQAHAWKSKLHDDGAMYEDYFIVGVETPMGQFTYHYNILHWGVFNVKELDKAPKWDGHTADDVVRLHSLDGHTMQYACNTSSPEQPKEITGNKAQYVVKMSCDGYSRMEVRKKKSETELFSFSTALDLLKQGNKICRKGWNGKDQYVVAQAQSTTTEASKIWNAHNKAHAEKLGGHIDVAPYCTLKTAQDTLAMGWIPSSGDLFANDWMIAQ